MFFKSFSDVFPNLPEIKRVTVLSDDFSLPKGQYFFHESYCPDPHCDCKKVIINILSDFSNTPLATIDYGWESQNYYKKWTLGDKESAKNMSGASHAPFGTRSKYSDLFLNMFNDLITKDVNYKNRIVRHYKMFKSKLKGEVMTVKDIVLRITYFPGYFPESELTEAIKNKEEITPHLLHSLEKARDEYETLDKDYWLHIPAIYLLSELKEKKAFPLIIDLLKLPDDNLYDLYGDASSEMGNFLASTYNGDFSLLEKFIEDEKNEVLARWEGLNTFITLEKEKIVPREQIIKYLKELFDYKLVREKGSILWTALISTCIDLNATELGVEALKAFDEGLTDKFGTNREEIHKYLIQGGSRSDSSRFHYTIKSTIDELKDWACFDSEEDIAEEENILEKLMHLDDDNDLLDEDCSNLDCEVHHPKKLQPIIKSKKVGRNESCPCGSGKKFKKCCLNKKLVAV